MMKPALARGELQCIGATTLDEYRKYIEKDAALERRFAPVFVDEPTVEETIADAARPARPLRGAPQGAHHPMRRWSRRRKLSHRYVTDRHLPDKAIDLMDEAAAKLRVALYTLPPELKEMKTETRPADGRRRGSRPARATTSAPPRSKARAPAAGSTSSTQQREQWQREKNLDEVVDEDDIAAVVAQWTGIPVSADDGDRGREAAADGRAAARAHHRARTKPIAAICATPSAARAPA